MKEKVVVMGLEVEKVGVCFEGERVGEGIFLVEMMNKLFV